MGSLISQDQLDTVVRARRGRRRQGRPGAHRRQGPARPRPVLLRADHPRGRHARTMTCFGEETFGPVISLYRFHDEADAVARANAGEYGLNALDLQPGRRPGPGDRPLHQVRHGQHQRGLRRDVRQHRLADGRHARVRDGPAPGQRGHPPLHRVAVGGDPAADPVRADARHVRRGLRQGDDRQPAADEEAGPRHEHELRLRRPRRRLGLRRLGHRAAADREGLPGRRARGRRAVRGRRLRVGHPSTSRSTSGRPRSACYGIQRIDARPRHA